MYKRIQRQNITCIIYWKCNCNRNTFLRISDRFEHLAAERDPRETSHVDL